MISKLRILLGLFILLGFTLNSYGQSNGKIKGAVLDANTSEPLVGANVIIEGTSIGTATDLEGMFVLPSVDPGEYVLNVSYIGYKDKSQKVTVESDKTTQVIINLEWAAVEGEVINVTAQASGQLGAINEQLSASELKNVVSKDQIRELPNQNAAESVGRLPGVSLLRDSGEGNKVVIRGLQPKYALVMVDGVVMAPNSYENRGMSMGSISSYSLEGIEVIKSPTANMDGDQVAGAVNFKMKTAKSGFNYEVVAQGGYNELRNDLSDYMFLGGVSNRLFNNKLGVYFQLNTDRKNMGSNAMSARYYIKDNNQDKPDVMFPLGINYLSLTNSFAIRKRFGGTLTLDYLIPDGKMYFKNFFSSSSSSVQQYSESYASIHNARTTETEYKSLLLTSVFNYNQQFSIFDVNAKLGYSYTGSETPYSSTFSFRGVNMDAIDPDGAPQDIPSKSPAYRSGDYSAFYWQTLSGYDRNTNGKQLMASLDFKTDFSISSFISGNVQFGGKFRYDERDYDYNSVNGYPYLGSNPEFQNLLITNIPSRFGHYELDKTSYLYYNDFQDRNFDHDEFLKGDFRLGPVVDVDLMRQINDLWSPYADDGKEVYHTNAKESVVNDYNGFERLGAGYIMAEFNFGKRVKFIPGVRYEAKSTTYNGISGIDGPFPDRFYEYGLAYHDTTSDRNNDFWLPMIHLRYDPFDWMQVRLAYTHTIARPNFNYIIPTLDIRSSSINMHNPTLRPELAKSYDLYFAFSENHLGLFTIGGFIKNIEDKIFSVGSRVLLNPEEYNIDPIYQGRTFTIQENNPDISYVKGFEIDWQTNFWYLPSVLKGLVFNINYTKIFSDTKYPHNRVEGEWQRDPDTGRRVYVQWNVDESYWDRMLSQPSDVVNLAIGYDYKGFSGRASMNYTADVFKTSDYEIERRVYSDAYLRWDLALNQKLPWDGFEVYCNVTNLTRAVERTHFASGNAPRSASFYDRGIYFGIRWRTN